MRYSTYRRNLLWNLNLLNKLLVSIQRTGKVRITLKLLTQICLHIYQSNQTVFDLEMYLGSLFNGFMEYAFCFDGEDLATVDTSILVRHRPNKVMVTARVVLIHTEQVG